MERGRRRIDDAGWTRGGLIRTAAGAAAVAAGGAAVGSHGGRGTSLAARKDTDAEILNFFLLLEYVQESFYREASENTQLDGDLLTFARTVVDQESEHVAFLVEWLGSRARTRPTPDFGDATRTPEAFRDTAIFLEEAAVAGYIGQGANLTRRTIRQVATLVSAEARQAAWMRNIAGVSPAPRAADPAREAGDVITDLRERGYL